MRIDPNTKLYLEMDNLQDWEDLRIQAELCILKGVLPNSRFTDPWIKAHGYEPYQELVAISCVWVGVALLSYLKHKAM